MKDWVLTPAFFRIGGIKYEKIMEQKLGNGIAVGEKRSRFGTSN